MKILRTSCTLAFTLLILLLPVTTRSAETNSAAGKRLYRTYCTPCHGLEGKGDGPGARVLPVRPADHTDGKVMNARSNQFLFNMILKGGAAMKKSPYMPAWRGQLREQQIRDLIAYIRSLAVPPYEGSDSRQEPGSGETK